MKRCTQKQKFNLKFPFNLSPAVEQGWSVPFWDARQGATTRNGPFHSRELQRSHVPQKLRNSPCSELTMRVNVEYRGESLWIMGFKLKKERSTTGFRFNCWV
jgi:hypothetical protein